VGGAVKRVYLVQSWDHSGALTNHYQVVVETEGELVDLRASLAKRAARVLITRDPDPAAARHA